MRIASGDLGATKTYAKRPWYWATFGTGEVWNPRTGEVLPGLGVATIKVQWAEGCGRFGKGVKCEVDSYCVQELPPEEPGTRLFALHNMTDASQGELYKVTIGGANKCRCQAGKCKVEVCKHRDFIKAGIKEGLFDGDGPFVADLPAAPAAA